MRHVIIGAGPAGVVAAETLRKLDPDSNVTMLSHEPEPPYSRMAIPYYLVEQVGEQGTWLRKGDGYFENNGITVRTGVKAEGLDTQAKQVKLAGGDTVPYDKLLIATGSHPIVPPLPGVDREGVHTCWTLEDSRHIIERAKEGSRVVLIGAGFIGCIILESLVMRKTRLTVIEQQNRMVPRMMDDRAGGLIKKWCQDKGVTVHTSTTVESIDEGGDGHPLAVRMDNGESAQADLVIVCVGVKANTAFLEGSGVKADQGILVDRHLQTSVEDVYAAGDVAQGLDFNTGEYTVQAIQPTAADHGRLAANNMAGYPLKHQGSVNMNVLDTLGLISTSFGMWMGVDGGDSAELYDGDRFRYINLQFKDDVLVGGSSLGMTDHVGVMRGLIQSKVRLGKWKERLKNDPTRIMEAYIACTQAIGHNARVLSA
ncbi:FAD-dependent oxidoreductase [Methylonatrum kenyense]|uniref:NAD(P)/FAD-dependent oxidoreductase n=1 Tax=Methylonatrum kenyense TaxID=455253 RepID=UPI0020BF9597|nr:FAD-dependent oxidoreductase [Methylonatrum kenyense]MCK8515576.1 FAD-dependent oxidoreductase [Methylonatrum kenyense]